MGTRFRVEAGTIDLLDGSLETPRGTVQLTANEVALLGALHDASPRSCHPDALLVQALGYTSKARSRTVTVTIQRLRKKVELDPAEPRTIVTVRGEGYALRYADPVPAAIAVAPTPGPRGRDLSEVDEAFARGGRPVVLIGPGGIGKTTLARAWARREGADWVELFGVRTPEALRLRLVSTLEPDAHEEPDAGLAQRLRSGGPVVLDNAEDLDDAARALLVKWLDASQVPVLVTSQAVLGAAGERRVVMRELDRDAAAEVVQEQRDRAGLPPLPATTIESLLDRFGGLPLALVIAAPLADFVDDDAVLLLSPSDETATHHSTVLHGVGRSLDRLSDHARRVAVALAVGDASCDVHQLGAVADLPLPQALGAVAELRGRGFTSVEDGRIDLLPVVRGVCRASPGLDAERAACEARLVRWLCERPPGHHVLKPLRRHIRGALRLAGGEARILLLRRHVELLYSFGPIEQIKPETERWLRGLPAEMRPEAEVQRAMGLLLAGERDAGRDLLLAVLDTVRDPDAFAVGSCLLSTCLSWRADPDTARWAERALASLQHVTREETRVAVLHYAGYALAKCEDPRGEGLIEEAIQLAEASMPARALSAALSKARLRPVAIDLQRCRSLLERTTPALGRVQHLIEQADLAVILLGTDQVEAGWELLEEPREVLVSAHPRMLSVFLQNAAGRIVDHPERARRLLSDVLAAEAARRPGSPPEPPVLVRALHALLDGDREALAGLPDRELGELALAFLDGAPLPRGPAWRELQRGLQGVRDRG
ncbi:MAG: winged helix-turn-helix domain-containing protein [Myxococcota bacterium]